MKRVNLLSNISIFVILLIIICCLGKYFWSRRKLYLLSLKLTGPVGKPLIGHALKFLCKKEEVLNVFLALTSSYPSPTKLWMGPKLVIVVKDPNQLQIILQSPKITSKAKFYRILEPFLGQGLITNSGPVHKSHKKLLQPLFSQRMVEGYSYLFQKHANKFVEEIKKHVDGPEFDVISYLRGTTFESTMDVLLEDRNDHSIDYKDVPGFVERFYEIGFTRMRTFWLHLDFIYEKTSYFREQTKMKQMVDTMIEEIINSRVSKVIQRLQSGEKMTECEETRSPSVLELIIEIGVDNPKCLSLQQGTDHLMTFIGASLDTTTSIVAFTCMMLGAYPHIQNLVLKELKDVLSGKTALDFTDLTKLKFLEMCIKETMRLYSVAPVVFRETTEEFQLDQLTIPKDVIVALSIYHVHRDPNLWEKPNEFYPEHFSPEAVNKRHPYAFIPFSAGPRKCLAQLYTFTNLKIFISTILLHYEIECQRTVKDIKLTTDISIRPIGGYFINIKKRS